RARLAAHPAVAGVEDDRVVRAVGEVPANVARIHAPAAHAAGFDGGPGAGRVVRVAIVDTGIDLDHPDLVANLDADLGVDCTGTGSYDDDHYHGTHVGGTVAAAADGSGVLGVGPGARLVPVKVLDDGGSGTFAEVACGLDHVRALATDADPDNDVQVVNMSLGTYGSPGSSCTAGVLRQAVCDLVAAGVTVVAAAGNSSADAKGFVPASYPELITVSALDDRTDSMASFTNHGSTVELTAPGVNVTSSAKGGGERVASGTSMAAPAVAGAAAVVIASGVAASPAEVVATLRTHGECPDGTAAGADHDCWGQGSWTGDRDPTAEPLVRVDDAIGLALPGVQVVSPARHHVVGGLVPLTVRTGTLLDGQSVRVRVGGGAWAAASPDPAGDTSTWPWDTALGADGTYALTAEVVAAGGDTVATATTEVVVRNGPRLFVEAPMAGTVRGDVPFRIGVRHATEPLEGLTVAAVVPTRTGTVALPLAYDAVADRFLGTWASTTVLDGVATVEVRATDTVGRTTSATTDVTVTNPPAVTVAAPAWYADVGGQVPIRLSATSPLFDAEHLVATWAAGTSSGPLVLGADGVFAGIWDAIDDPEGSTNLRIEVRDPDGRVGSATRMVTVRNRPSASLVTRTVANPMSFTATASSPLHPASALTVRLDAREKGAWDLTWDGTAHTAPALDTTTWPEGSVTADLTVTDPDGRTDTAATYLTVSKAPTLKVVAPTSSTFQGTVAVAVVASDPWGTSPADLTVSLTLDGAGPVVPLVFDPTSGQHRVELDSTAWPDGAHHLHIKVTTPAGRSTVVQKYAYASNPYIVSIVSPTYGADVSGDVPLLARVTMPTGPARNATVVASVDDGPPLPMAFDDATGMFGTVLPTADWTDGSRYVRVTAKNAWGSSWYGTVRLDFVNSPTLTFVSPAGYGTASGPTLVAVRAGTPSGGPVDVTLDVGTSGPPVPMVLDEASGEHRVTIQTREWPDGYLDLRATVTDALGRARSVTRTVYASNPLSVTPLRPAASATVGGAVEVAVKVAHPGDLLVPGATVLLQVDAGVGVAMAYDAASGEHRATLHSTAWYDGSHNLRVNATDPQGRTRSASWYVSSANRPTLSVHAPATGSPYVTGPVPIEVTAADPQTAAGGLMVTATPTGAAAMPLAYDAALGRYVGTWDSSTVPDGTTSLTLSATDADGMTASSSRSVRPRNTPVGVIAGLSSPVDGVVTVQLTARRGDGSATGVRHVWRVDGGAARSSVPDPTAPGRHLARLDTSALGDGAHTLSLEITDEATGRTSTVQQLFGVAHGAGLGAGLIGPVPGTTVSGLVPVEAVVYRPVPVGGRVSTAAWYRVDGGPW
ncbi:MAG TPA: S8 family serine peptidase, partial [Acidimicrobiales bacterium]|nr:S8 family serine peptidase [Acidimicrobiales bacterium]